MDDVLAISVIGLGKLGLPLAACLASRGFDVVGVDSDARKLTLESGHLEPNLDDLLARSSHRLTTTASIEDAVASTDMTFIVVQTPSGEDGSFSIEHVLEACESIGAALSQKDAYHVVVVTSTVMPGATAGPIASALEESSGRHVGQGLGLCYSPEFIALGGVIHGLSNPDFVLVGESDERAGDRLCWVYGTVCENDPPAARMSIVNAELAKLALNSFLTVKISFANMVGEICEGVPGARVDVVTAALGLDSRINPRYLRSATGYGGPCFPRDNRAFAFAASRAGASAPLAEAADAVNRAQTGRLADRVLEHARTGSKVAVLGLAYKPGTEVVEQSAGLLLAERLAGAGLAVSAFDPAAAETAAKVLPDVQIEDSLAACVTGADVVVITTPWPELRSLIEELERLDAHPVVVDCWRLFEPHELAGCTYVAPGSWPAPETDRVTA